MGAGVGIELRLLRELRADVERWIDGGGDARDLIYILETVEQLNKEVLMTIFDGSDEAIDRDILRALCYDLGEVESQIAPLEAERQQLRDKISLVLARMGNKAELAGFGKLELTAPAVVHSYDKKRLDELLIALAGEAPEIAERLAQCRTESARIGGLRITRGR